MELKSHGWRVNTGPVCPAEDFFLHQSVAEYFSGRGIPFLYQASSWYICDIND